MTRWTLLASVVFLTALTGSYMTFARRAKVQEGKEPPPVPVADAGELSVEAFDLEDGGEDQVTSDNTFNMTGEAEPEAAPPPRPRVSAAIETIEDEDDPGETVEAPVVMEEPEGETIEVASPAAEKTEEAN